MTHGQLLEDVRALLSEIISNENLNRTFFVREAAFNGRGAMSEMGIFEVVGITNWLLNSIGKEWEQIYPVSVKKLITGYGKADKKEVADALRLYVGERNYKTDDESDATAVAIAWLIQQGQIAQKQEDHEG